MPPEIMDMPYASQSEIHVREAAAIKPVPAEVVKEVAASPGTHRDRRTEAPAPQPELRWPPAASAMPTPSTGAVAPLLSTAFPDGSHLLRLDDFDGNQWAGLARPAVLRPPDPQSREELQAGGYVHLEKLKGNKGNQNYEIPADIDPSAQGSVIIYCMPFHVIFSVASLEPGG